MTDTYDDYENMHKLPPCPACHESASGFCAKHSAPAPAYHSKSEMRRLEAQKQDPLDAAAAELTGKFMSITKAGQNGGAVTTAGELFKAGAAWAYANPKVSEAVDAYIAKVFPCTPPCNSYGVCDNCCDAKLIRVGSQLAANPPAPQVSVEDEAAADYFLITEDQDFLMSKRDYHERGYEAGHASGRRSGEAEVAELKQFRENETALYVKHRNAECLALAEITKLTAELAESEQMRQTFKEWNDILGSPDVPADAIWNLINERDALKSQLTQAQADVAALVDAASLIDDLPHSYANMVPVLVERACTKVRAALARVKGRS